MMKELIIIGAGGMGRALFNIAIECKEYIIKGFIDDNTQALDTFKDYPSILGTVNDYEIQENDVFICSIGNISIKKHCCQLILDKGGTFISLIHPTARICTNVQVGTGCIIGPFVSIGADTILSDFSFIQSYSAIGHDVNIGYYTRVDTHVVCVGGVLIGDEVTIHTGAIINHKVVIENRACVGGGSFVIRRVKEGITVYGNPAKKL